MKNHWCWCRFARWTTKTKKEEEEKKKKKKKKEAWDFR